MGKGSVVLFAVLAVALAAAGGCKRADGQEDQVVVEYFRAEPATVDFGSASTLSWSVSGVASVTIDNGVGAVPPAGEVEVRPAATTTYTLVAGSRRATATVTVNSAPPPGHAAILYFKASRSSVPVYEEVTVSWAVANARAVTLDGKAVAAEGSFRRTYSSTATHSLLAVGDDGQQVGETLKVSVDRRSACEWLSKPPDWEFLDLKTCRVETQPNGSPYYAGRNLVYRVTVKDPVSGATVDSATGTIPYVGPGAVGSVTVHMATGKRTWDDKAEVALQSIDCQLTRP